MYSLTQWLPRITNSVFVNDLRRKKNFKVWTIFFPPQKSIRWRELVSHASSSLPLRGAKDNFVFLPTVMKEKRSKACHYWEKNLAKWKTDRKKRQLHHKATLALLHSINYSRPTIHREQERCYQTPGMASLKAVGAITGHGSKSGPNLNWLC